MQFKEKIIEKAFLLIALSSISVLALITFFIFEEGFPLILKIGLKAFLFGEKWIPSKGLFGIFPMIMSSFWVTFGALLLGIPLGLACTIFLSELIPPSVGILLRPAIQLLAAIPSVIYGFWGLIVLIPLIQNYLGGPGLSILAGSLVLSFMILPTIITISEDSLKALPPSYKAGALALGATHWQTIWRVILPAASSGILAAVMLGIGRVIGETMAVMMITGNSAVIPQSIFQPVRTLTATIAAEMGEAVVGGEHYFALFAIGVVLFVISFIINVSADLFLHRKK